MRIKSKLWRHFPRQTLVEATWGSSRRFSIVRDINLIFQRSAGIAQNIYIGCLLEGHGYAVLQANNGQEPAHAIATGTRTDKSSQTLVISESATPWVTTSVGTLRRLLMAEARLS
jgi:hypothetical protein